MLIQQWLPTPLKDTIKQQALQILRLLHVVKPAPNQARNHVVPNPIFLANGRIVDPSEARLPFSDASTDPDVGFTHNNFSICNIIVTMTGSQGWWTGRWPVSSAGGRGEGT